MIHLDTLDRNKMYIVEFDDTNPLEIIVFNKDAFGDNKWCIYINRFDDWRTEVSWRIRVKNAWPIDFD